MKTKDQILLEAAYESIHNAGNIPNDISERAIGYFQSLGIPVAGLEKVTNVRELEDWMYNQSLLTAKSTGETQWGKICVKADELFNTWMSDLGLYTSTTS